MTCIARGFATKKALKEHVLQAQNFNMEDPSIFNPYYGDAATYLKVRGAFCVTNHPKRSWFARVFHHPTKGMVVS